MTRRRDLLSLAGLLLLLPRVVAGQPAGLDTKVLGYLGPSSPGGNLQRRLQNGLFSRLQELGYAEGKNLRVERRFAGGRFELLPQLAAELVAVKPDLIFAAASQATLAAAKATSTIPIVFAAVSDPVGLGIVKSLARPGTNATGFSLQNIEVHAKRVQLVREIWPSARRIAVLHNPLNVVEHRMLATLRPASQNLRLETAVFEIKSEDEFDEVFRALRAHGPDVLYVLESPFSLLHMARIVEFANRSKLPAVYGLEDFALIGGLMSYAFDVGEHYRMAADYVAKVLKGARPGDLPIQQPTRFELILNLKTAKDQGIAFPPGFLARADRVIQ